MSVLAIDFDGVLCDNNNIKPGFRMGEPMPGAIEAMRRLKAGGDTVVIFTARDRFQPVRDWLDHFGIPYDDVTNIKRPEFDVIVDDRAVHFTNWNQVTGYI